MFDQETGFVLKRFLPSTHKISLLTSSMGKINLVVKKTGALQRAWPGMLIAYQPKTLYESTFFSESIEIMEIPPTTTADDNFIIHHLLELCYYFVPLANPCSEIFDHLCSCFAFFTHKQLFEKNFDTLKRIFILRFLYLAGVFPLHNSTESMQLFTRLTACSLDIKDQQKVESISMLIETVNKLGLRTVDKLIFDCIKTHPSFKLLKTVPFLYE